MSGLGCIVNFDEKPVDHDLIHKMTDKISYRGPDGKSCYFDYNIGISYLAQHSTPESVYEVQPLLDNESGIILVADARVDNREDLISELSLKKNNIVTDVQLILHAYLKWGSQSLVHIIGDFAFILWDSKKKLLFAGRDPMGVRSLHYAKVNNSLYIASEAQQILQLPDISSTLDEIAVIQWLSGQVKSDRCMFKDISIVPPAHYLLGDSKNITVNRYWDIDFNQKIQYRDIEDYKNHFIEKMSLAVDSRLRTNSKTVGTELSGGLDSTVITALAHRSLKQTGIKLKPVSYTFPTISSCDESDFIKHVASYLGVSTHFLNVEQAGILGYPAAFKPKLENPWVRENPVYELQLKYLKEHGVEVLLTGNGGDEVTSAGPFANYKRFWHGDYSVLFELFYNCRKFKQSYLTSLYTELLEPILPNSIDSLLRYLTFRTIKNKKALPVWLSSAARQQYINYLKAKPDKQIKDRVLQSKYDTLINGIISGSNSFYEYYGARYSIEIRQPFLDRRVIEYCFAIPNHLWRHKQYEKWLLRLSTADLLPDQVRWRKGKQGASEVIAKAISRNMDYVEELFKHTYPEIIDIYDIHRLKTEFHNRFNEKTGAIFGDIDFALSLQCWLHSNKKVLC